MFMCMCVCLDGYYNNYNNKIMWSLFNLAFNQTAFFVLTWMSCCHLNEMLSIISTARTSRNVFFSLLLINAFRQTNYPSFPSFLCVSVIAGLRSNAHCRALLQNVGFMSPFHFLYSSFSSLQLMSPLFPLPHTFTDTHSCVGCRTYAAPRGVCGGQRSGPRLPAPIKWTDSWWEGEREYGLLADAETLEQNINNS